MTRSHRHSLWMLHRSRLLALPFVVLCALAYVGSVAHFALVQHATCLEHGEVLHVGEGQEHAQLQPVEDSSAGGGVRITRASAAEASHDAEAHCAHTFFRREGVPPPAQVLLAVEAPAVSGLVLQVEQVHAEPVARLRLAPKASPPLS